MQDQHGKIREVAWNEICPWLILIRCIGIALTPRVFVLGAIGLMAVTGGWQLVSSLYAETDDPVVQAWRAEGCQWIWESSSPFTISVQQLPRNATELVTTGCRGLLEAPVALWIHMTRPFLDLFDEDLTPAGFGCLLMCGIWEILVWALVGGAITRIAALKLTRGEAPDIVKAIKFAGGFLVSYVSAPLIALLAASLFAGLLALCGLAMRVDVIALLVGLAWPLVLVIGLLMAMLLIGLLVGWPFMWATISVEATDAFDALSRAYAYAYQRPLRLAWYVVFAALVGGLGLFVVKVFALATIGLSDWSINWGLDNERLQALTTQSPAQEAAPTDTPMGGMLMIAHAAIKFWTSMLAAAAAGYQVGYLWTAAVAVYLLLRRDIDSAEMDEVFVDDKEPEFGMPALEEDDSGVPEVAPDEPAIPGDS